jgi:hypothetical protein
MARRHPSITFYTYTKSVHFDLWTSKPRNVNFVQSSGGRFDHLIDKSKPHAIVVKSESDIPAGYVNGTKTDLYAAMGIVRIALIAH